MSKSSVNVDELANTIPATIPKKSFAERKAVVSSIVKQYDFSVESLAEASVDDPETLVLIAKLAKKLAAKNKADKKELQRANEAALAWSKISTQMERETSDQAVLQKYGGSVSLILQDLTDIKSSQDFLTAGEFSETMTQLRGRIANYSRTVAASELLVRYNMYRIGVMYLRWFRNFTASNAALLGQGQQPTVGNFVAWLDINHLTLTNWNVEDCRKAMNVANLISTYPRLLFLDLSYSTIVTNTANIKKYLSAPENSELALRMKSQVSTAIMSTNFTIPSNFTIEASVEHVVSDDMMNLLTEQGDAYTEYCRRRIGEEEALVDGVAINQYEDDSIDLANVAITRDRKINLMEKAYANVGSNPDITGYHSYDDVQYDPEYRNFVRLRSLYEASVAGQISLTAEQAQEITLYAHANNPVYKDAYAAGIHPK